MHTTAHGVNIFFIHILLLLRLHKLILNARPRAGLSRVWPCRGQCGAVIAHPYLPRRARAPRRCNAFPMQPELARGSCSANIFLVTPICVDNLQNISAPCSEFGATHTSLLTLIFFISLRRSVCYASVSLPRHPERFNNKPRADAPQSGGCLHGLTRVSVTGAPD